MNPIISRIDHVSIAVRDYEKANRFFQALLGAIPGASGRDAVMKYFWQLFSLGDLSRLEIITPTAEGSFLDHFLSQRDGGVHHITLQTRNIEETKELLDRHGIPYFGYREYAGVLWKELFIHPRNAFGVLIQIAEFHPNDWLSDAVKPAGGQTWTIGKKEEGIHLDWAHPGGGTVGFDLSREEAQKLVEDLQRALDR
ncbi:MAG TPA: VOC family protein [Syntrophales bacterium]|jgi:methylmalonyl-CoA/ethylmalonyl-CoA epimerase|nr:VOC family protein [Syntrophales bacterium]HPX55697.1 VOC family protein [Syntrophales bacterium]HQA81851.1 VOC family protein [Syntrophales bacterium]